MRELFLVAPAVVPQLHTAGVISRSRTNDKARVVARASADDACSIGVRSLESPIVRSERDRTRIEDLPRPSAGLAWSVVGTGFEEQDPSVRIFGETRRHDATGAAASDDDDVVRAVGHAASEHEISSRANGPRCPRV